MISRIAIKSADKRMGYQDAIMSGKFNFPYSTTCYQKFSIQTSSGNSLSTKKFRIETAQNYGLRSVQVDSAARDLAAAKDIEGREESKDDNLLGKEADETQDQ